MQDNHWHGKANQLKKLRVLDNTEKPHVYMKYNHIFCCRAEGMLLIFSNAQLQSSPLPLPEWGLVTALS